MVELLLAKQKVEGSSPFSRSRKLKASENRRLFYFAKEVYNGNITYRLILIFKDQKRSTTMLKSSKVIDYVNLMYEVHL